MANDAESRAPTLPTIAVPGWREYQRIDRPAVGAWPSRRQVLLAPVGGSPEKSLLRLDVFDAGGAGSVERVMSFLVGEVHAAGAKHVQAQALVEGGYRWQWKGLTIVGRNGVVVQLCNAGDETHDLSAATLAVEAALLQHAN